MIDQIALLKNAVTPEFCDHVLSQAKEFEPAKVVVGLNEASVNSQQRVSETCWLRSMVDNLDIFQAVTLAVKKANEECFNFELYFPESLQVTLYKGGDRGMFRPHVDDGVTLPSFEYQRKLSCSIMLSDHKDYVGGDFVFYALDQLHHPETDRFSNLKKGDAVVFPSYLPHSVDPVTEGCRASLVSWFNGPKFK